MVRSCERVKSVLISSISRRLRPGEMALVTASIISDSVSFVYSSLNLVHQIVVRELIFLSTLFYLAIDLKFTSNGDFRNCLVMRVSSSF